MKRILVGLFVAIFLTGCHNGMKQSILEPLEVKDLKKQMKNDPEFSDFYKAMQEARTWIMASDMRQAKYGDITYARVKKFNRKSSDTTFQKKLADKYHQEYDILYPDYTEQVDSIIAFWREYWEENKPESFVKIRFKDLWKERYYDGDIKNVNFGFEMTPLKGKIDQLIFRYCVKTKISNDGKMDIWDSHRCNYTRPLYGTQTGYWEASYSDEKRFKYMTADEIKRDYVFLIEIDEVRINGVNIGERIKRIPHYVKYALDGEYWNGGIWKDEIITENIDPKYVSFWDFARPKYNEELKKIDPLVYELLEEMEAGSFDD